MSLINDQLRAAAETGDAARLKVFLLDPKSDALSKSGGGWTALMYAARGGHEACLQLLLPVSDPLAISSKE